MRRMISFRYRIAISYSVILFILLTILNVILYFSLKNIMYRQIENTLMIYADDIGHEFHEEADNHEYNDLQDNMDSSSSVHPLLDEEYKDSEKYIQILNKEQKILFKSNQSKSKNVILPIDNQALAYAFNNEIIYKTITSFDGHDIREIYFPNKRGDIISSVIQLGLSSDNINVTLNNFFYLSLSISSIILFFSAFGGLILAKQTLKPIDEIVNTVKNITDKNLKERLKTEVNNDELNRLMRVLNEMLDRLEYSFESQKRFTADASHEIRLPLTIMKGNIEVLLRKKRKDSEYIQVMESNLEEINRLSRITNSLLMLARADSGEIEIKREQMNLFDVVYDVYKTFIDTTEKSDLKLTISGEKDAYILGDADKIKQLITNLLENAVRYTQRGGEVNMSIIKDKSNYITIVKDSGIGIDKEELPRIFDRFYRSDSARTRESGGSGLGLSICQCIATAHNGSIIVESEKDRGSSFIVTLPINPI